MNAGREDKAVDRSGVGGGDLVKRLMTLANRGDSEGRGSLFGEIADLYEERFVSFKPSEHALILDILRRLTVDVALEIRRDLAVRLANKADVPKPLVLMLAEDDADVGSRILSQSPLLDDAELIEIVRHRTMRHRLAVSIRNGLSEDVSSVLVACGEEEVIVSLLNNATAHLRQEDVVQLVERSQLIEAYCAPLVRREDLPNELAQRMLLWVSAGLHNHILKNYDIDPSQLDGAMREVVKESLEGKGEVPADAPMSAAVQLVEKLHRGEELSVAFAVRRLLQGDIELFEVALAKLADVPVPVVRRLIYDGGDDGLAIVARACGIDRAALTAIHKICAEAKLEGHLEAAESSAREVLAFYDGLSEEAASRTLQRLGARETVAG